MRFWAATSEINYGFRCAKSVSFYCPQGVANCDQRRIYLFEFIGKFVELVIDRFQSCLLYTSDAADE